MSFYNLESLIFVSTFNSKIMNNKSICTSSIEVMEFSFLLTIFSVFFSVTSYNLSCKSSPSNGSGESFGDIKSLSVSSLCFA